MKHAPLSLPLAPNPSEEGNSAAAPASNCNPYGAAATFLTLPSGARIGFPPHVLAAAPPSAAILAEVQALREHHMRKGHTPDSDSLHSEWYFRDALEEMLRRARAAKRPATRRKNLIIAVGVLVAQIDAEDFRNAQLSGGNREHDT